MNNNHYVKEISSLVSELGDEEAMRIYKLTEYLWRKKYLNLKKKSKS